MKNTIQTIVAEEIYNDLTFSHAKQYKTIHGELLTKHLFLEQT